MPPEPQSKIPAGMDQSLLQRDQSPMGEDRFVKFQLISMMPGIAKNFRYLINNDGSLFYAANSSEQPEDRTQIFTTPIPEMPTRQLSPETLADIQDKINEVDFFSQPEYQASKVRDGSLTIVTIRKEDQVHEVWYANTHNSLTDLLHSIFPDEPVEMTAAEQLALLKEQITDLQQLSEKLQDTSNIDLGGEDENTVE